MRTNNQSRTKIVGLTTDPYNNIYGYSLVFFRLFDYLQRNYKNLDVELLSNSGVSSTIVKNPNFKLIKIEKNKNILLKTIFLVVSFIRIVLFYDKNTIIVANCELPELIAGIILKIKFKKVYGIIHDDRIRNDSIYTVLVCKIRIFLIYRIKNVIFINKYTMTRFNNSVKKYYIGNPIFY